MALSNFNLSAGWTQIGDAGTVTVQNLSLGAVLIVGADAEPENGDPALVLPAYGDFLQLEFATDVWARAASGSASVVAGSV